MKKYKNKPRGKFRSQLEYKVSRLLAAKKRKYKFQSRYEPTKIQYELKVVFDQQLFTTARWYIPDWIIQPKAPYVWYLEVKGYFDQDQMEKMLAVKNSNPGIDIRFFFAQDNKIRGRRGTRYSDWCIKHGFEYCIGELPEEWFE